MTRNYVNPDMAPYAQVVEACWSWPGLVAARPMLYVYVRTIDLASIIYLKGGHFVLYV
jgi:hypothetical protein